MNETERTAADVIRDVVRGLCGLPSAEIAWRVVDALGMAGYRIVPLRERTLTARVAVTWIGDEMTRKKEGWRQRFIAMSGVALAELLELEIYRASEAAEKDRAIWAHTLRKQVMRGELNCLDADEWYTGGYGEGSGGDSR